MTVLSIPLGVPWYSPSTSNTSAEAVSLLSGWPRCAASARAMAVDTAVPLPIPLATGMVEWIVIVTSGTGAFKRLSVARTMAANGSSGAASAR